MTAIKLVKPSVAIIGSRGIPAAYGGFETITEAIAPKLIDRGWNVYVSCEGTSRSQKLAAYKGVKLFYFPVRPFFRVVYETLYDIYSLIWASLSCDCICMLGYGAGIFFFIPKFFGKPLVVNVDGLEWMRPKFNKIEKSVLLISERAAAMFASALIADSLEIKSYWEAKYKKTVYHISYGTDVPSMDLTSQPVLGSVSQTLLKLDQAGYWLVVSRIEPENNIATIVRAYLASGSRRKLVIVGDSSNSRYKNLLAKLTIQNHVDADIIWAGPIYDTDLLTKLRQNCFAYLHGNTVGGTNPALLQAMSAGALIIAHDNKYNRETGQDTMIYFKNASELTNVMLSIERSAAKFGTFKEAAKSRANNAYSWDKVVEQYDKLFAQLCLKDGGRGNPKS